MNRAVGFWLLLNVALAQTASPSPQDRATYRNAYSKWRSTDPNLERDAASGGANLGARADAAAGAAAAFYAARKTYLDALQADAEQKPVSIEAPPAPPEFDGNPSRHAALQSATINRTIESIANDPDRAIQQLRLALERERAALTALTAGLNDVQKGRDAVTESNATVEQSRVKLIEHYQAIAFSIKQTAQQTVQVGTLWGAYYRALSDSARGIAPRESAPVTSSAPIGAPSPAAPNTAPNAAPAAAPIAMPNPAPVARAKSITPLPLSRYVGAWVYPTVGARFHGAEPEFVDMVIHEENGQATGTLFARFKLPQGSPGDPTVRFDFEGAFQSTRNQSFALVTSGGAKGSIELIPGPAFNLIEVTFTSEDRPGTVRQGNFLLIKK